MIPSPVPNELMEGGQRGYSGHCVNLPQNITELANFLPRFPKDFSIIIIKTKGSNDSSKKLAFKVQPSYADVKINYEALNSLPENNVPPGILSVEADDCHK